MHGAVFSKEPSRDENNAQRHQPADRTHLSMIGRAFIEWSATEVIDSTRQACVEPLLYRVEDYRHLDGFSPPDMASRAAGSRVNTGATRPVRLCLIRSRFLP
jgi:hypothetical protein